MAFQTPRAEPPPAAPPPPPPAAGGDAYAGRTVVSSPRAAPEPSAPAPAPARAPAPVPAAPAAEAGATRYSTAIPDVTGKVVGVLVAVEGELEGEVYRIYDGENRLGRANECEVTLPSEWISRQHAMIMHQGGIFAIKPLTDRNATIVNDERIEGAELGDGAYLKLGKTTFRFRSVV